MWNKTKTRNGKTSTALEESINRIFFMGIEIMNADSTSKCKFTTFFCKSTLLVLRN